MVSREAPISIAPSACTPHSPLSNASPSSMVLPSGATTTARTAALPWPSRPALLTRNCTRANEPSSALKRNE